MTPANKTIRKALTEVSARSFRMNYGRMSGGVFSRDQTGIRADLRSENHEPNCYAILVPARTREKATRNKHPNTKSTTANTRSPARIRVWEYRTKTVTV